MRAPASADEQKAFNKRMTISKRAPTMQVQDRHDDLGLGTVAVPTSGDIKTVTISRQSKSISYGFGLGTTVDGQDVVTSVTEGGPADGELEVTDVIKAVNGEDAGSLSHQDIIDRIVAGTSVEITVLRARFKAEEKKAFNKRMTISKRAPTMQVQNRQDDLGTVMVPTTGKKVTVSLIRGSNTVSYGFGLGTTTGNQDVVTSVAEGGPADGVLEVTDMIAAVNGEDAGSLSHQDIIARIVADNSVEITVLRAQQEAEEKKTFNKRMTISKRAPTMQVQNRQDDLGTVNIATGDVEHVDVTLVRPATNISYGFGLGSTTEGQNVVTKVTVGGVSHGELLVSDIIMEVNGEDALNKTHDEVIDMILNGTHSSPNAVSLLVKRAAGSTPYNKRASISKVKPGLKIQGRKDSIGKGIAGTHDIGARVTVEGFDCPGTVRFFDRVADGSMRCGVELDQAVGMNDGTYLGTRCFQTMPNRAVVVMPHHVELCGHHDRAGLGELAEEDEPAEEEPEEERKETVATATDGTISVVVSRASTMQSFGFGLGLSEFGVHVVSKIGPSSPALDKLMVQDVILELNGQSTSGVSHENLIATVMASLELKMKVRRSAKASQRAGLAIGSRLPSTKKMSSIPASLNAAALPTQYAAATRGTEGRNDDGSIQVTLTRDTLADSFGFGLGETDTGGHHIVSKVNPGGRADGVLKPADRVTSVNGVSIDGLSHESVVEMLIKNTSIALVLRRGIADQDPAIKTSRDSIGQHAISRQEGAPVRMPSIRIMASSGDVIEAMNVPGTDPSSSELGKEAELAVQAATSLRRHTEDAASAMQQVGGDLTTVILERLSLAESFGVGFKTGKGPNDPAYVSAIKKDTVAHLRLSKGDKIIQVNGVQTAGQDHANVAEYFRSTLVVELLILPNTNFEMVDATITRPDAAVSFGFSLGQLVEGGELVITEVKPSSPSTGKLELKDVVVSINGTSVAFSSDAHRDATDLCRTSGDSIAFLVRRKVVA